MMSDVYLPEREDLHKMVKAFCSVHVDNWEDGVGPNKPDAPFFMKLARADALSYDNYVEIAQRLKKYTNTQLPLISHLAGYSPDEDWESALEAIRQQGEEYKVIKNKGHEWIVSEVKTHKPTPQQVEGWIALLISWGYLPEDARKAVHGRIDYMQYLVDEEEKRVAAMKVTCSEYEETWYGRNDHRRRWPKKSKRLGIYWTTRNRELYRTLNEDINKKHKFPAFKWDGSKMSCKIDRAVVTDVAAVLKSYGYDATLLLEYRDTLPVQSNVAPVQQYTVEVKGEGIMLGIPRQDANTRERVKTINGRKWVHEQLKWRIAISEAHTLIGKLGEEHEISKKMMAIDTINKYVESKAKRIAISGAAALDDESVVSDMKKRLATMFPAGHTLYPFQYAGVRFAELADGRCYIGDDMGLGKTVQAIAYAALHQEYWPVLVVCPANVKYNWVKECSTWLPTAIVDVVANGKDDVRDADITVINYDLMNKKKDALLDMEYNLVIFDESHYLKNNKALRTKASVEVGKQAESILCLSGTAMTNRPIELFTTLELVRPAEYEGQFMPFAKRYCGAQHNGWGWDFTGSSNEAELHEKLRDVMIRRLKKEVMQELPDKVRQFMPVVPTNKELVAYQTAARSWVRDYDRREPGYVLRMLTDLRHRAGRLKVGAALDYLEDYMGSSDKPLLMFYHHKDVGAALTEGFNESKRFKGMRCGNINGDVAPIKRQEHVEAFQRGEYKVLFCSTPAAKEGLTLTAADTVVFLEREWVSGWEEQAEDRINRIGQDAETVWAVYLSVAGTIDERFDRIVEQKRAVVSSILDGGDIGEERDGIAMALLQAMIDAGDIPADVLWDGKKPKVHGEEEE